MALSDLRRLAGATARQSHGTANRSTATTAHGTREEVDARTLLTRLNMTFVTQATFPAAIPLDRGYLLLYEDLQLQKDAVLRSLFAYLGIGHLRAVADELRRQESHPEEVIAMKTHWQKASEDVCGSLPPGNCEKLREALRGKPCLLKQLLSTTVRPWSFQIGRAHV